MFHMCVCVFWSYVIVNHFNFNIIFMGLVLAVKQPYVYLGIEPYIVFFNWFAMFIMFARFA